MDVSGLKALVNSHNMHVSLAFQFHLNTYSNRIFQLNKPPIDPISNPFPYFSNALVGKMSGLLSVLERLKVTISNSAFSDRNNRSIPEDGKR